MIRLYKFRLKYLYISLLTAFLFFTLTWKSAGNYVNSDNFYNALTGIRDTVPQRSQKDSLPKRPVLNKKDSALKSKSDSDPVNLLLDSTGLINKTDTFSFKISKDSLDAPVHYEAEDSAVVLVKEKKVILYGKTKTNYKEIELTAPQTELNQETRILTAVNKKDSAGVVTERANFKEGENAFTSDTIRYNFKTQRGLTKNTHTMQGEIQLQGDQMKREGDIIYARRGLITTCNLDEPHFGFRYDKIKMINKKVAITGPVHPEFEGVTIPVYLPFGFFPTKQGRHSGLLQPQFTANEAYGLGLEGLGYYKVLNENFDLSVRGNIYSYGGWSANITPSYRKRYRYNGQMNFSILSTKLNFKGDPDYTKNLSYNATWSHAVDSRARPGTSFSANVNAGSTKYNGFVPNNPNLNYQNQLGSSVTYSRTFKNSNLTISANHNQNNALRLINLNLPDIGYTINTLYPFQGKEIAGTPKWYEKLGVAYNGTLRSQISFYDTAFRFTRLIDTLQWGGQNNFPITLSLPPILGGKFLLAPNISYQNKLIAQKFRRSWNGALKKVDTSVTKGFYMDQSISMGLSLNTAIYGTFQFKKSRVIAIRHVIRPAVSFSYSPSLSKSRFYETQLDTTGRKFRFSEFERSLNGYYNEQDFGGMSFALDNNLEMKLKPKKKKQGKPEQEVKDEKTTEAEKPEEKKIRLIDGYGVNAGYNFIADSFKLSNFNFYLRSNLFEKINLTAATTLNPYQVDGKGFPVNKYAWQGNKFKLGRFSSGNLSLSTDFRSKPKDAKKEEEKKQKEQQMLNDPSLASDVQSQLDYMRRNPSQFVDFNIPWTINLGLSINFSERLKADYSGFDKEFRSNLNFNGSFSLTPKWNFNVNGYYDFKTKNLQTFTMSITRDMHCWQMSINVTPVGRYRFFNFSVSPKSGLLQNLKVSRTRYFQG
jgi:lipopolysaccharide assembly outer membrane protein LptD (OstA)